MSRRGNLKIADRQKVALTVVYFVDNGKTSTAVFSVRAALLVAMSLVLLMLWSVGSTVFLVGQSKRLEKLSSDVSDSLSQLFLYQGKYEGHYSQEKVQETPKGTGSGLAVIKDSRSSISSHSDTDQPSLVDPYPLKSGQEKSEEQKSENSRVVAVRETKIEFKGEIATVKFSLQNRKGKGKAEGYIWGLAKFGRRDGPTLEIAAPAGIRLGADFRAENVEAGERFSIKKFKTVKLEFDHIDATVEKNMLQIALGVYDSETGLVEIIPLQMPQVD